MHGVLEWEVDTCRQGAWGSESREGLALRLGCAWRFMGRYGSFPTLGVPFWASP